jgi:hypothetical protein
MNILLVDHVLDLGFFFVGNDDHTCHVCREPVFIVFILITRASFSYGDIRAVNLIVVKLLYCNILISLAKSNQQKFFEKE